jgi:hypothetical protein
MLERLYDRLAVDFDTGCWNWSSTRYRSGYGKVGMGKGHRGKVMPAHRAMWEAVNGPIPDGLWVLHRCDNRACCRPEHLWLGTSDDNVADMVAKRRHRPQGRIPVNIGERKRRIAVGRKV